VVLAVLRFSEVASRPRLNPKKYTYERSCCDSRFPCSSQPSHSPPCLASLCHAQVAVCATRAIRRLFLISGPTRQKHSAAGLPTRAKSAVTVTHSIRNARAVIQISQTRILAYAAGYTVTTPRSAATQTLRTPAIMYNLNAALRQSGVRTQIKLHASRHASHHTTARTKGKETSASQLLKVLRELLPI
jgi:hypothetical protein